jgi:TolA-binding protein
MSPEPCSMALLVEAKWDGRLGHREVASVDRHLLTCSACAALVADLERIRAALGESEGAPTPLEVQRGRLRLLREAARPVPPVPRGVRRPAIVAAVLIAAAVVTLVVRRRAPEGGGSLAQTAPSAASAPLRTTTIVTPDPRAHFARVESGGTETVTLHDGAVNLSVRHLQAGERYLVKTGDAEVEVRGTVFRVEAAADHLQSVSVTEGRVEVRFGGAVFLVNAEQRWDRPSEPQPSAPPSASVASTPAPPPIAPRLSTTSVSMALRPPRKRVVADAPNNGSDGLIEGVGLIRRGDYGAAADRLDAFARTHPDDDRAEDSAFLVIVALQRAGRRPEAAAAAKSYLARYPAGYHREEAKALVEER